MAKGSRTGKARRRRRMESGQTLNNDAFSSI
jgi:hypothetical protein